MSRSEKSIKLGFVSRRKGNSPAGICYIKDTVRRERRVEETQWIKWGKAARFDKI